MSSLLEEGDDSGTLVLESTFGKQPLTGQGTGSSMVLFCHRLAIATTVKTDLSLSQHRGMRSMRLLFETPEAARKVAFMLQCEYDGCTMITLSVHDTLALRTAIELTGAACCFAGDHHPLVLSSTTDATSDVSDPDPAERMRRKAELWQDVASF